MKRTFLTLYIIIATTLCTAQTVNVLDYGAKGDGVSDDTYAVQTAIYEASKQGTPEHPCTLIFPTGHTFLCAPLELRGNVNYHLEKESCLLANPNEDLYRLSAFGDNIGEGMLWLWANGASNISFSGEGVLDGNGVAFMGPELEDSYVLKDLTTLLGKVFDPRPHLLTLFGCRNIEISGITVQNGAYWTIHLVGCIDARIHDMKLFNKLKIRNGDGIDLDHTQHVKIWNCHIESGDDCVCLKNRREYSPGYMEAMHYLGRPEGIVMLTQQCGDIEVWSCTMTSRSCSIKIGSENMDSISDVHFHDCIIRASNRGLGIQNRDEGTVTRVTFENIQLECHLFSEVWWGQAEPIYVTSFPRAVGNHKDAGWRFPKGATKGSCGEVSHITFRNILAQSENGCYIGGDTTDKVNNITLENVQLTLDSITTYPHGLFDRRPCVGDGFVRGDGRKFYVDQAAHVTITNCK